MMEWLTMLITSMLLAGLYLWTLGALYYDAGKSSSRGILYGFLWTTAVLLLLICLKPLWLATLAVTALFAGVLVWWLSQKPSHDRQWDANFARLPFMEIQGDQVAVRNVRNTKYRSLKDYDTIYEERHYRLSDLSAVDLLTVYWGSKWICHPLLIFEFGDQDHLCISIEVRYRQNQKYEILPSLFRQAEIIYLACDERDAILRRTKYVQNIDCYLYRLKLETELRKQVFMEYAEQINQLFHKPSWYNALTRNCTTSVYQQRKGKMQWDWRLVVNGKLDEMLYDWERLDTTLPFEELKDKSWINERANGAPNIEFSNIIRSGLPGFKTSQ